MLLVILGLVTWVAGAVACLWALKTDRSDLSLMFWDPDGVTDAIDISWIEWVLAFSWPIWPALAFVVFWKVTERQRVAIRGRWLAIRERWVATRRTTEQPTSPAPARRAQQQDSPRSAKEQYREAEAAIRKQIRDSKSPAEIARDARRKREEQERRARRKQEKLEREERSRRYQEEHYLFYLKPQGVSDFEALGEEERRGVVGASKKSLAWSKRADAYVLELAEADRAEFDRMPLPQKQRLVSAWEGKQRLQAVREEQEHQRATAQRRSARGLRAGVRVRPPKDADDFEAVCAEWTTKCGVRAERTAKGPDGGLDVIGPDFAGQCKFHPSNKVGAPDVQQLAGAALGKRKDKKAFFHYGPGYTTAAIEEARATGVELWQYDVDEQTFRRVLN